MSSRSSYTATLNSPFSRGRGSQPLMSSPLSASISSRTGHHRHHSHANGNISKIYRQASTLFLTRRLPEALTTLVPLISPPPSEDDDDDRSSHTAHENDNGNGHVHGAAALVEPAPVASASRTTRVKIWSLYLTILNAILELEPDEGKDAFGSQDWRALCSKVRDGDVWEEVVQNGYHGVEGDVDGDVVINLATLLLAHAKSQALNQKRLENYLSYSQMPPNFDLSSRFDASFARRSLSRHRSPTRATPGADTPRDLNTRVKILELYTLHVLLRNDEWDYAREFIAASPLLDEERREAFLQALQSLQEDQHEAERREQEERQHLEAQRQRELDDERRTRAANEERERRRIEEERARRGGDGASTSSTTAADHPRHHRAPSSAGGSCSTKGGGGRPRSSRSSRSSRAAGSTTSAAAGAGAGAGTAVGPAHGRQQHHQSATSKARGKSGTTAAAAPPSLSARTAAVLANLRGLAEQVSAAVALQAGPLLTMRTLLFIAALLVMLGRRNMRERIARIMGSGWAKVKATAGMGVKVSYI